MQMFESAWGAYGCPLSLQICVAGCYSVVDLGLVVRNARANAWLWQGAFYQPRCVMIDTDVLSTLPDRELASGIAEVVKYGLIRDADFFQWQVRPLPLRGLAPAALCSAHPSPASRPPLPAGRRRANATTRDGGARYPAEGGSDVRPLGACEKARPR